MAPSNLNLMKRVTSTTPQWFRYIRNAGLVLTAISTTVATCGVGLPAIIVTVAGYCAVAGAVATAVSQTAVEQE
jgi:hypothetical protein